MLPIHAPADTLANVRPFVAKWCTELDAPTSAVEMALCRHTEIGYLNGMTGEQRAVLPGYDTGVMALLILVFLLLAFSLSNYEVFLKIFRQNLGGVRRRDNVFDEHTMPENGLMLGLTLLACLCEGILIYFAAKTFGMGTGGTSVLASIMLCTGGALCLLVFQTVGYLATGYAFTTYRNTVSWLKGFVASQAMLGICLVTPAIWLLFNPGASETMIYIGVALYLIMRLAFICKGFRIFYTNLFSLVYFILYLCTLEIVPLIFFSRMARFFSAFN